MIRLITLIPVFLSVTTCTFADEATQTDWSGGDGIRVAYGEWDDRFYKSDYISYSETPDVLRLGYDHTIYTIDDAFNGVRSIYSADVDDDGDMDVLGAACLADDIAWWENDGTGTGWIKHLVDGNCNWANSVYSEDIDGDGDMDVLGTSDAYIEAYISWWSNEDGAGTDWTEYRVTSSLIDAGSVRSADVDGDDDMDILATGSQEYDFAWWENNGPGTGWEPHGLGDYYGDPDCIYPADLDGDGDTDILGCGSGFGASNVIWWSNNDGLGTNWTKHEIVGPSGRWGSVCPGDIDDDGDLDVIGTSSLNERIAWWVNVDGSGTSWVERFVDTNVPGADSPNAVDVDADGDIDIVCTASYRMDIAWWENVNGLGTGWTMHIIDDYFPGAYAVYAAHMDDDDALDILGASGYDDVIVWWDTAELNYCTGGELKSSIKSFGGWVNDWGTIDWTDYVPIDTNLTLDVRASNDSWDMGDWVTVTTPGDDLSDYIDNGTRFFQYRVLMDTSDVLVSPTFEDITISWDWVGIDGDESNNPAVFALHPAVPNPSGGSVSIGFALPRACEVELALYDIKGRKVATLAEGTHQPGEFSANTSGLSSGVYIYELTADEFRESKKMVVR
jgi:hypothetical protein